MAQKSLHKAADYYEPLLQVRVRKALKSMRKKVSINALAMSMVNPHQAKDVIPRKMLTKELEPLKQIIKDAFRQGGRTGADMVSKL